MVHKANILVLYQGLRDLKLRIFGLSLFSAIFRFSAIFLPVFRFWGNFWPVFRFLIGPNAPLDQRSTESTTGDNEDQQKIKILK